MIFFFICSLLVRLYTLFSLSLHAPRSPASSHLFVTVPIRLCIFVFRLLLFSKHHTYFTDILSFGLASVFSRWIFVHCAFQDLFIIHLETIVNVCSMTLTTDSTLKRRRKKNDAEPCSAVTKFYQWQISQTEAMGGKTLCLNIFHTIYSTSTVYRATKFICFIEFT